MNNIISNTAYRSSHNAQQASRDAFKHIAGELTGFRKRVFEVILRFGPVSNKEIAARLEVPVHHVCGRVLELRGWLYDMDLKKSVLHEDKVFVKFHSYAEYKDAAKTKPNKRSGCRWVATDLGLGKELELF